MNFGKDMFIFINNLHSLNKLSGVWCYGGGLYMHTKCSGLSTKNDQHSRFICRHCNEHAKTDHQKTAKQNPTPSIETLPETCNFWKNFKYEQTQTLPKFYNKIVHWKPIIFTVSNNKVSFEIADVVNIINA